MSVADNTPVLIGVGEASERIDAPDYAALSPVALAAKAAAAALTDAGAPDLAQHIDLIASIRQFEVSGPGAKAPFGCSNNFSRSVASRIGADPAHAIIEVVGGQGPQHLVNEMAHAIAAGEVSMALLTGSEAISTVRHLTAKGETRDWAETVEGSLEDRGYGMDGLLSRDVAAHGGRTAISLYALLENARRGRLGLGREAYARTMADLFAPFTRVAAGNPHAMSREVYTAEDLATVTQSNRLTSDPFPRRMVARDQANQGAAVLLTSLGRARALGVGEDRFVYLHGGADAKERTLIERSDYSRGPAAIMANQSALAAAGIAMADVNKIDFYSCFPIAVFNLCDGLGIAPNDPRGLTMTGGLPYFGGAGNNYSMHAIASMIRALRASPGQMGLVSANGGFISKTSVGVYSTRPAAWRGFDSSALQAQINAWPAPPMDPNFEGDADIDTYTIDYAGSAPVGVILARNAAGNRIVAAATDAAVVESLIRHDPMGGRVTLAKGDDGRTLVTGFTASL